MNSGYSLHIEAQQEIGLRPSNVVTNSNYRKENSAANGGQNSVKNK
jgi:hypothetical protein